MVCLSGDGDQAGRLVETFVFVALAVRCKRPCTGFPNIFNHPSFALPSSILAAPNFGTLFQTPDAAQNNVGLGSGGPRLIQFALKLSF